MIHVEFQDPGYLSLYCFNGLHIYINGQCVHCDRKDHTVEYKPVPD